MNDGWMRWALSLMTAGFLAVAGHYVLFGHGVATADDVRALEMKVEARLKRDAEQLDDIKDRLARVEENQKNAREDVREIKVIVREILKEVD